MTVKSHRLWPSNKAVYGTRLKATFLRSNLALRINKVSYWLSPYRQFHLNIK